MKTFLAIICCLLFLRASSQHYLPNSFFVRTTGWPFLEYGPGDDRLGGAKMTFLDTNILLKVIDSFKTEINYLILSHDTMTHNTCKRFTWFQR